MQGSNNRQVMAMKDGISMSSSESSGAGGNRHRIVNNNNGFDDDISTITLTTDNKLSSICTC